MKTLSNPKTNRYFVLGVLLVAIGVLSTVSNLGLFLPFWVISWHTILLAAGLLIGYRKDFKFGGWILMVFFGALFTLERIVSFSMGDLLPALLLIGAGAYLLLKPAKPAGFDQHIKE